MHLFLASPAAPYPTRRSKPEKTLACLVSHISRKERGPLRNPPLLGSGPQPGAILSSREHPAMCGDLWLSQLGKRVTGIETGEAGVLLNSLPGTGQPRQQQNYQAKRTTRQRLSKLDLGKHSIHSQEVTKQNPY